MQAKKLAAVIAAAAVTLAAAETLLRVDSIPESKIVHKAPPEYPPDARDARIEGVVKVGVIIARNGHVEEARLISGHPLLAPAALQAAKKWVFQPFERDGKPVRATATLEIPFALSAAQ
ncbi:MAG TPA: energy transducer TonB [Bryobacteraceae bacterium]|nr:energy transducer TonB [Bryobacteraceae bacterium]